MTPVALNYAPPSHRASCFGGGGGGKPVDGPTGDVEFSHNPQDKINMSPETIVVKDVGVGPEVEKAVINSDYPAPANGGYVYPESDQRYHAANAFSATANTIAIFEEAMGRPIEWAFRGSQLEVNGDAGEMLNAYYSRNDGSINFFHSKDTVFNRNVFSGDSGEVVAHEAGHAILDGFRPSYLRAFGPAPGGFHESFGDVLAMLVSLKNPSVLDKVMAQTGGDLSQPNVISDLGEELGMAINHYTGQNTTGGDYTRRAINDFKWQDPSTLPGQAPHDQLSRQVHSYSRLWTGAMYDVFEGIHASNQANGMEPKASLAALADEGLKLYGELMNTAPQGNHTYRDMAQSLLAANANNGGSRADLITSVMKERRILPDSFSLDATPFQAPSGELRVIETTLKGDGFGQFEGAVVKSEVEANLSVADDGRREAELQSDLKQLIASDSILFTTPGQVVKDADLFGKDGNPYIGVVRWESGQMEIERVQVLA